MARQKVATAKTTGDVIVFTFATGEIREINASKFSPEMQHAAMLHGFKQKFGDSYAGLMAEEAVPVFDATVANVMGNEWNKRAEAGEKAPTLEVAILARLLGLAEPNEAVANKLTALKAIEGRMAKLRKTVEWVDAKTAIERERAAKANESAVELLA